MSSREQTRAEILDAFGVTAAELAALDETPLGRAEARARAERADSKERVMAEIDRYNRDRCACGGSPLWYPPDLSWHLAPCTALREHLEATGYYDEQT